MEHTPTPWRTRKEGALSCIVGDDGDVIYLPPKGVCTPASFARAEANRAFILKACNAHDGLVELAKTAAALAVQPVGPENEPLWVRVVAISDLGKAALAELDAE
jgi:hypothetical protein